MSSSNCFAVIHTCISTCLSLTLIDLLLNVRCIHISLYWKWTVKTCVCMIYNIIHPVSNQATEEDVIQVMSLPGYGEIIVMCKCCLSGVVNQKTNQGIIWRTLVAQLWCVWVSVYCLDWVQWKLTRGFKNGAKWITIHAYYLAWGYIILTKCEVELFLVSVCIYI